MKKSPRYKKITDLSILSLSIIFLIAVFGFNNKLTAYTSNLAREQIDVKDAKIQAQIIDSAYNYKKNGLPYKYTFLEFGSKGCIACKNMEDVLKEIKNELPNKVNVIFLNVTFPENKKIMEYFGIVMIPTQVLLDKEGKEFFRHTGFFSSEDLKKKFL